MPKLFSTLPLIAALAFGSALHAQEDTATAAETAAHSDDTNTEANAETDAANDADSTLDMGTAVDENLPYIKETYGDWQLKCFRSEGAEDLCQMYQLLTESGGNPVAEFSLYRLPEGSQAEAGATIVVPLGTLLSKELRVSIDAGKAKSFSYSFCTQAGCFSRIGLTNADIEAFKRGATATIQIVPAQAPDQTVDIKASLKGFTAAYENVSTVRK